MEDSLRICTKYPSVLHRLFLSLNFTYLADLSPRLALTGMSKMYFGFSVRRILREVGTHSVGLVNTYITVHTENINIRKVLVD